MATSSIALLYQNAGTGFRNRAPFGVVDRQWSKAHNSHTFLSSIDSSSDPTFGLSHFVHYTAAILLLMANHILSSSSHSDDKDAALDVALLPLPIPSSADGRRYVRMHPLRLVRVVVRSDKTSACSAREAIRCSLIARHGVSPSRRGTCSLARGRLIELNDCGRICLCWFPPLSLFQ